MRGTPFLLGSGLSSLTAGGSAVPNGLQLMPPFRTDYLIKEIRFNAQSPGVSINSDNGSVANQLFYRARISVGTWQLTNGHIPISLLCPQTQLAVELGLGLSNGLNTDANYNTYSYSQLRWIFPRPMYVADGNAVIADFQRILDLTGENAFPGSLEMAVVCETVPQGTKRPPTSCVPFVSAYQNNGVAASMSQALNLQNPFNDRPLHLQRFIGRYYQNATAFFIGGWNYILSNATLPGTTSTDAIISLQDSDRFEITPATGLRFGEAFDARTKSLEHRRLLPPKGWVQAKFWNANTSNVYWVSLIGFREEKFS